MTNNETTRLELLQQMREVTKAEHAARFSNNPEEYRRLRAEWVALSIRYEKMLRDEVFPKRTTMEAPCQSRVSRLRITGVTCLQVKKARQS